MVIMVCLWNDCQCADKISYQIRDQAHVFVDGGQQLSQQFGQHWPPASRFQLAWSMWPLCGHSMDVGHCHKTISPRSEGLNLDKATRTFNVCLVAGEARGSLPNRYSLEHYDWGTSFRRHLEVMIIMFPGNIQQGSEGSSVGQWQGYLTTCRRSSFQRLMTIMAPGSQFLALLPHSSISINMCIYLLHIYIYYLNVVEDIFKSIKLISIKLN